MLSNPSEKVTTVKPVLNNARVSILRTSEEILSSFNSFRLSKAFSLIIFAQYHRYAGNKTVFKRFALLVDQAVPRDHKYVVAFCKKQQ